ncbi:ATP-binding protein [Anaerospora hongkongensis]|uniref:ATP-binding protein n=1 Tax=Anaerospora hongkongensis TaxID=244830 RepID=UPI002FDB6D25
MAEYAFGANIIENLTTGMYQDSKVIYREYIQNACDQIDKAEKLGILKTRNPNSKKADLGQGIINIWLEPENRYIAIEDNATGIQVGEFQRILSNIADSDKIMGQDKGFRGIGRLCGLAYCKRLVFTSRWAGENIVSIMSCDALKMRKMINETNTKLQKYSASDVLNAMTEFSTRLVNEKDAEHFFRVELIDINDENEELFGGKDDDNLKQLTDYLAFVAPVPYSGDFHYRSEIYNHAKELNTKIDEYVIKINGQQIFKKYKTHLNTGNGKDHVFGVEFHDFVADDNTLIGWMWFGKTSFKAAIKEEEISRGLRLRKENIQIGEDDTLRDMFTREASKRGNNYFIGEIFATSRELIPNSQRAYFNENPARIEFEHKLKNYFNNTLYYIYYEGSDINSSIKKINSYHEKASEFEIKKTQGNFLTTEEQEREELALKIKEQEAEKAKNNLEKKREGGRSILTSQIIERRTKEFSSIEIGKTSEKALSNKLHEKYEHSKNEVDIAPYKTQKKFLIHTMFPCANRKEQKLLAETLEKIFAIIQKSTDKKTSENLINRIKDELK